MPVVPDTREAKARGSLELKFKTSLGKIDPCLKYNLIIIIKERAAGEALSGPRSLINIAEL